MIGTPPAENPATDSWDGWLVRRRAHRGPQKALDGQGMSVRIADHFGAGLSVGLGDEPCSDSAKFVFQCRKIVHEQLGVPKHKIVGLRIPRQVTTAWRSNVLEKLNSGSL